MYISICLIALVTALACVIPGIFLVLRGVAMMSDAISHATVLGIVIAYLCINQLSSPWLFLGAVLSGIATVVVTELLINTGRIQKDVAIGLVFPLFFSIGIILISRYAHNVHLDVDMVLLGELTFAPLQRIVIGGVDYGPRALWLMGSILLINIIFIWMAYRVLVIATFDTYFARVARIPERFLHYMLMILTSITVTGAFEAVGSLVVVALMIAPAATALLIARTVPHMIALAVACASIGALGGCFFGLVCDVSLAGAIAMASGMLFIGIFAFRQLFIEKKG